MNEEELGDGSVAPQKIDADAHDLPLEFEAGEAATVEMIGEADLADHLLLAEGVNSFYYFNLIF